MKLNQFAALRSVFVAAMIASGVFALDASNCNAQWGFFGRGPAVAPGALRYRGPMLSIQVAPAYPPSALSGTYDPMFGQSRFGSAFGASPYDRYRMDDASYYAANVFGGYRGMQPTQAELDREKFYYNLDRTHRYQTREERYGNDFSNAYASPSAMVDRYKYPYVAGTPSVPWTPQPVPGLSLSRRDSRYQGYVPDEDVAVALRAAANRLKRSLARKADGHVWIRHLKPDQIIDAIDRGQQPVTLSDLIVNYEGVADNPRLVLIAEAEGFQDVRRLLAQYVTLQSPYPSVEPIGQETILNEQVIGEQVIGNGIEGGNNEMTFDAPVLPMAPTPSPLENETRLDRPTLDNLPDAADVEMLPAPMPTPAK